MSSWIPFLHLHLRGSFPDPKCYEGVHRTAPSPQEAASPFNFSGARRSYTILGKRVGVEQRKVILTKGRNMQMWASREQRRPKKNSARGTTRSIWSTCSSTGCSQDAGENLYTSKPLGKSSQKLGKYMKERGRKTMTTENFLLEVSASSCNKPSYSRSRRKKMKHSS